MHETHTRSLIKAITFRILATIATFVLVLIFTGNFTLALNIGVLDFLVKMAIYYWHERAWLQVKWGTTSKKIPFAWQFFSMLRK